MLILLTHLLDDICGIFNKIRRNHITITNTPAAHEYGRWFRMCLWMRWTWSHCVHRTLSNQLNAFLFCRHYVFVFGVLVDLSLPFNAVPFLLQLYYNSVVFLALRFATSLSNISVVFFFYFLRASVLRHSVANFMYIRLRMGVCVLCSARPLLYINWVTATWRFRAFTVTRPSFISIYHIYNIDKRPYCMSLCRFLVQL